MRLMLTLGSYPPDVTAQALRMRELVDVIARRAEADARIVVHSLGSTSKKMRDVTRTANNVHVVRYELKYLRQLLIKLPRDNPLMLLVTTLIVIREAREYKPDLILTTVPTYSPTIAAYLASLLLGKQFCIDIRDDWTSKRMTTYVVRKNPRYSRIVNAVTSSLAYALFVKACQKAFLLTTVYDSLITDLQRLSRFKKPVIYVPNGINLSELEDVRRTFNKRATLHKYGIPIDKDLKYVIHVGTIRDYHKPEVLIKPLQKMINEGKKICYIIVGDANSESIAKEIETHGNPENDIFLINVAHNEVLALLLASDIAFYALSNEFPFTYLLAVKILEYVGCKLPILAIANEHAMTTEFIKTHGIGIALRWNEISLIGSAIEKLLHEPLYASNIDAYYPSFVKEFERKTNSEKLYETIVQNYQAVAC